MPGKPLSDQEIVGLLDAKASRLPAAPSRNTARNLAAAKQPAPALRLTGAAYGFAAAVCRAAWPLPAPSSPAPAAIRLEQ